MRIRRTSMILLGVAALAISAMSQGAAARYVDPLRETGGRHLYPYQNVTAVSPTSAFFAGDFGMLGRTRFKEWDGHSWANAPGMARPHSSLRAIDAIGSDDVWAVGTHWLDSPQETRSLIVHWNGTAWRVVDDGGLGHVQLTELDDVSMAAPDDVWAVGWDLSHGGTQVTSVFVHWDGSAWQLVPAPVDGNFSAVTALGSGDVWIAGQVWPSLHRIILHWDGHAWSRSSTPGYMASLDALSPDDVWAVGTESRHSPQTGVIEHWDGTAWTVIPSPQVGEDRGTFLTSVSAVSADDVWVVGQTGDPKGFYGPTWIEHWDGQEWSVVPSPSPGSAWNYLEDVSGDSAADAWAAGVFSNHHDTNRGKTLLLHWDGTTWTRLHHLR
jgi:hypothetical protein